ncbi:MAG: hypothetical protein R3B70_12035 [Polyangiaceae bacterium]
MFSGDSDPTDDKYSSAYTMNFYGLRGRCGSITRRCCSSRSRAVSNYTGAVTGISNRGFGLASAIATASYDIIPNELNLKVGGAFAQSMARPPGRPTGWRRFIGSRGQRRAGLSGAVSDEHRPSALHEEGEFYNGNERVTDDPWALFTTFNWIAF